MKYYLLFFCFALTLCKAQNFNYTISIDSSIQYSALSEATVLSPNSKWLPSYEIPTGFTAGSGNIPPQTVVIETNGFVIYNKAFNSAIMAFNGFHCKLDSNSNYSQLSYLTTGTAGSKILKVEFKNVGQYNNPKELLNYQLWIKESGGFEIAIGPNTYEKLPGDTTIDTNQVVSIGLINRNMDAVTNGVFISGTPNHPNSTPISSANNELPFMRTVPKKGYKYIFTPITN